YVIEFSSARGRGVISTWTIRSASISAGHLIILLWLTIKGFSLSARPYQPPGVFSFVPWVQSAVPRQNRGCLAKTDPSRPARFFFHACTIGDNTLITRAGAKTRLIATRGFGDAILMMRGMTAEGLTEKDAAHTSALVKLDPIVPRTLIEELTERIDYKGSVVIPLKTDDVA